MPWPRNNDRSSTNRRPNDERRRRGARHSHAGRFNFANDIEPLLSRFTCNSSGCHGKAEGQNGFKLSVFAFDPRGRLCRLDEGVCAAIVSSRPRRDRVCCYAR